MGALSDTDSRVFRRFCWFLSLLLPLALLISIGEGISYPPKKTGGSACTCLPNGTCAPMYLSFQPPTWRPYSSFFQDVPADAQSEDRTLTIVSGFPLPDTVVIQVMTNMSSQPVLDLEAGLQLASVVANGTEGAVSISYKSVSISNGRVIIEQLMLETQEETVTGYLVFTLSNSLYIISPIFQLFQDGGEYMTYDLQLSLSSARSVFFIDPELPDVSIVLTAGEPIPAFTIYVRDASGYVSPARDGFIMQCNITTSSSGSHVAASGDVETVDSGRATFDQLTIDESFIDGGSVDLRFFLVDSIGFKSLLIEHVHVVENALFSAALSFSTSSFIQAEKAEKSVLTAAIGVPMPQIEVTVVDSRMQLDERVDGVSVTASCAGAMFDPAGSIAIVVGGVATFQSLTFSFMARTPVGASRALIITFTAGNEDPRLLVAGSVLFSPVVEVSYVPQVRVAARVQLSSTLGNFRKYDREYVAVANTPVDLIVVEVVGLDNVLVPTTAVSVAVASFPPQSLVSVNGQAGAVAETASGGLVTLRGVVLTNLYGLTVSLTFYVPASPNVSTSLVEGFGIQVRLLPAVAPAFGLRFAASPLSYIASQRHVVAATASIAMKPIVVEVVKSDGTLDDEADSVLVTASSALSGKLIGQSSVSYGGRAVFSELVIPKAGLTTLLFTATCFSCSVAGKTVKSAPFPVYSILTQRVALAFANGSFANVPHKPLTIAFNAVLPPIGVAVLDSTGAVDRTAATALQVVASISSGRLNGTTRMSVNSASGIAWFTNIVVSSLVAPVEARLIFSAVGVAGAPSSVVVGKTVETGTLSFQSTSAVMAMTLVPYLDAANNLLAPLENMTMPLNESIFSSSVEVNEGPRRLAALVSAINGAGQYILPSLGTNRWVTANSTTLSIAGSTRVSFPLDTRPVLYPAQFPALLSPLVVSSPQLVRGHFDVVTIRTEAFAPRQLELELGPFVYASVSDAEEPIVVAEVELEEELLDLRTWIRLVAAQLNVDQDRIEIIRTRRFGTASIGTDLTRVGTHVELRFSSPSTSTRNRASSKELATLFVAMSQPCGSPNLYITRKYFVKDTPSQCDLFQLEEQWIAVQRCLDTTQEQCNCHLPLFEVLAGACGGTDHFIEICSGVTNCLSDSIRSGCDSYKMATYVAYALVGVYALLFLLAVGAVMVYRKELIQKCMRERLSNRNRRDVDYQGLKVQLLPTEHAEPLDIII
jgi:hypothetical protein